MALHPVYVSDDTKHTDPLTTRLEMTAYYGLNMGMSAICQIGPVM